MKTYYMVIGKLKIELPKKFDTQKGAINWVVSQMKPECRKAVRKEHNGYYYHSIFTPII